MSADEIETFTESLENECDAIRYEAIQLAWTMRGGIQYNDVMNLSLRERQLIAKLSKENIEIANKSGLPYF